MMDSSAEVPKKEMVEIIADLKRLQKRYISSLSPNSLDSKFVELINDLELLKDVKC